MKRGLSTGDITATGLFDENDNTFTKPRNVRKKSKRAAAGAQSVCSQPVQNTCSFADHIADNPDISQSITPVAVTVQSEMAELRKAVEQLSSLVDTQKTIISNLSNKLKFVLSFLDINDCEPDPVSLNVATLTNSVEDAPRPVDAATGGSSVSDTDTTSQLSSRPTTQTATYANVAALNRVSGGSGPPSNFRHAVAAVVYADQRAKERRAKSVVVSGMASSPNVSDAVSFQRLCMLELGVNPAVIYTRRLGLADGDRVQPLLVGLRSADEVTQLLSDAKKLRQSTDDQVRNNTYINKNLTKVEARLAYEERCRRRDRQQTTRPTSTTRRHDDNHQPPRPSASAEHDRPEAGTAQLSNESSVAPVAGRQR